MFNFQDNTGLLYSKWSFEKATPLCEGIFQTQPLETELWDTTFNFKDNIGFCLVVSWKLCNRTSGWSCRQAFNYCCSLLQVWKDTEMQMVQCLHFSILSDLKKTTAAIEILSTTSIRCSVTDISSLLQDSTNRMRNLHQK